MHDAFKGPDHAVVFRCDKREGVTQVVCPTGAADTMDVGISGIGHVEVDDVRDAFHVQAACGNVRGNHDLMLTTPEAFQRGLPLPLGPIAVKTRDAMSGAVQLLRELLRSILGASEDQD